MTQPLMQLVEQKLDEHPGETILGSPRHFPIWLIEQLRHNEFSFEAMLGPPWPAPTPTLSFEAYKAAVVRVVTSIIARRHAAVFTPPDPSLISLESWRHDFIDSSDDQVARTFADSLYFRLQGWRDGYFSSARWRAYLGAFDHPGRWLELGREAEADGWTIEANACFAAARWLEPSSTVDAITEVTAHRSPNLPARLLRQPDPSYPAEPFHRRHWLAWDMKEHGRIDLPTLLRWECDRNFSIRTRIYRSLGQQPHPAAIQALQEGTLDPHPFARAQAVRSLGRCVDPTSADVLGELARKDPDAEVRRTAAKAIQRIVGYWRFYGEWNAITGSPTRLLEVARALADEGLPAFASDILYGNGLYGNPEGKALIASLECDALLHKWSDRSNYPYWFREARALEETPEPELDPAETRAAAGELNERGFETRRTLRRLDLGSVAERRAQPARR